MKKAFLYMTAFLLAASLTQAQWGTALRYLILDTPTTQTVTGPVVFSGSFSAAVDSGDIAANSLSVLDILNGNNGFVTKPSFNDSLRNRHVYVRADSFVNLTNRTSLYSPSLNVLAAHDDDTLRLGALQMLTPYYDKTHLGDYVAAYQDSTTTDGNAADTTGTRTSWWQYRSWVSATSGSMKTSIWQTSFVPLETGQDSLTFNAWFNGTAATADSGAIMVVIKNQAGNIVSTGWKTVAVTETWEHFAVVIPTPMVPLTEYSAQVYCKCTSGKRWCWTAPRFN